MTLRRPFDEDGIAVVAALTAMTLLLALGAALTVLTTTETRVSANDRDAVEAFYAADSAVALAISQLRGTADWPGAISGVVPSSLTDGAPAGVRTLGDGTTIDLDREQPAGGGSAWCLYVYGLAAAWLPNGIVDPRTFVAVWIRDGGDDSIELVGRAYGPRGARRTVEVTMRRLLAGGAAVDQAPLERLSWRER